jgi:hypothetical protein
MMLKVLVCGGRNYSDKQKLYQVLDGMHSAGINSGPPYITQIVEIINGGATGADKLAQDWSRDRKRLDGKKILCATYLAQWNIHGGAAGPIRNQEMLDKGKPDIVVAFPGGEGTADMVSRAKTASVPVVLID